MDDKHRHEYDLPRLLVIPQQLAASIEAAATDSMSPYYSADSEWNAFLERAGEEESADASRFVYMTPSVEQAFRKTLTMARQYRWLHMGIRSAQEALGV